ncbi:MAG: hypothetical protein ACI809_002541, partial [Candidatus Azotimanducaceae bacterium]
MLPQAFEQYLPDGLSLKTARSLSAWVLLNNAGLTLSIFSADVVDLNQWEVMPVAQAWSPFYGASRPWIDDC